MSSLIRWIKSCKSLQVLFGHWTPLDRVWISSFAHLAWSRENARCWAMAGSPRRIGASGWWQRCISQMNFWCGWTKTLQKTCKNQKPSISNYYEFWILILIQASLCLSLGLHNFSFLPTSLISFLSVWHFLRPWKQVMFGTWMRRSKVLTPSNTGETPCFEKCLDWMNMG